jgi:hypothetical protein
VRTESQLIKRLYVLRMHSNVVLSWRSADKVSLELGADQNRRCLIEQNPHLGGKFDNGFDLFSV